MKDLENIKTEFNIGDVIDSEITTELKTAFLSYSMSVITSRALPDVRDGLKPIHRRIIYAMYDLGLLPNKPFKKSAKIVGEVIAKYHPHGDASVYGTLVRMGQYFNYLYPMVIPQGNFGSIDGDNPAAMRYTEAKMSKYAQSLVEDIELNTVDFTDNYDNSEKEPIVLPAYLPNLLINGSDGIAVGMATSIPPHNLGEVIEGVLHLIKNPNCQIQDLLEIIKGPDFPTHGLLLKDASLSKVYTDGYGSVCIRAKVDHYQDKKDNILIVTEIPYQVNKANLVAQIAQLSDSKKIRGIKEIRDETSREGIRVVIILNQKADVDFILNGLYKYSQLQTFYHCKMLALVNGRPKENLNLKEILTHYLNYQKSVVTRKTTFLLNKNLKRENILIGLTKAIANIEKVIEIIKSSLTTEKCFTNLYEAIDVNKEQAQAILDMRLQRLVNIETKNLQVELKKVQDQIEKLKTILSKPENIEKEIFNKLVYFKNKYQQDRRTEIVFFNRDISDEQLVREKDVVLIQSKNGYIKTIDLADFRMQNRGGVGAKGVNLYEKDEVLKISFCNTLDKVLFFTNFGKVYAKSVFQIPESTKNSRGNAIINIIPNLETNGEKVISFITYKNLNNIDYLLFLTKKGKIKKLASSAVERVMANGKKIVEIKKHNDLIQDVEYISKNDKFAIFSDTGKALLIKESSIRASGRTAYGVKGINVANQNPQYLASLKNKNHFLLISSEGYGKITHIENFKSKNRGGLGVNAINLKKSTNGKLVFANAVNGNEDVLITTKSGKIIYINIESINATGRASLGVKFVRLSDNDKISSATICNFQIETD